MLALLEPVSKNQEQNLAADKRRKTQMKSPANCLGGFEISASIGGE
jgi:hypothetical protein